jgi:hypothetical protein
MKGQKVLKENMWLRMRVGDREKEALQASEEFD